MRKSRKYAQETDFRTLGRKAGSGKLQRAVFALPRASFLREALRDLAALFLVSAFPAER